MNYQEMYETEQRRRLKAEEEAKEAKEEAKEAKEEAKEAKEKIQEAEEKVKKAEEKTEEAKKVIQPTTLPELLAEYHAKFQTMETGSGRMAGGTAGKAVGRKYPKRITPWSDFASRQQRIWNIIRGSATYSKRLFNSLHDIRGLKLREISSELDLVLVDDLIVLNPVQAILNCLFKDEGLRGQLVLHGNAGFLSIKKVNPIPQPLSSLVTPTTIGAATNAPSPRKGAIGAATNAPSHPKGAIGAAANAPNHPKDVGGQADAFFYAGHQHRHSIEYKLLTKLPAETISEGLQGEIITEQDVIHNKDKSPEAQSRDLVVSVITQLYSYLLKSDLRYGYISTGVMIIFLHILANPEQVVYHIWNPQDFNFDLPASIHNTAVAEVTAFSIQAMVVHPLTQKWREAVQGFAVWPQEYESFPGDTPKTNREESTEPDTPVYKPSRQADFLSGRSSPIRTRQQARYNTSKGGKKNDEPESPSIRKGKSGCRPKDLELPEEGEDPEDGESPMRPSDHTGKSIVGGAGKKGKDDGDKRAGGRTGDHRKRVREREYCSLSCLLGLSKGGHLDLDCPNIADHGKSHLTQPKFLALVREQLAHDRGLITDCEPLWINGSRGEMFKITLTSHGYTVIAKGVQIYDVPHLKNEAKVYHHLRSLQGIHIPVCLGAINLIFPYYHKGGIFVRFLFQSYAGVPVSYTIDEKNYKDILSNLNNAMEAIHQLRVLHCDPIPRNFLINEKSGVLQVIDFERARIYDDEKEGKKVASSRKKKLLRGARLAKANETVVPSPSSPAKNSTVDTVEQPARQNREGTKMTRKEFLFKEELRLAYCETFLKIR